jgi:hypothetical protein
MAPATVDIEAGVPPGENAPAPLLDPLAMTRRAESLCAAREHNEPLLLGIKKSPLYSLYWVGTGARFRQFLIFSNRKRKTKRTPLSILVPSHRLKDFNQTIIVE